MERSEDLIQEGAVAALEKHKSLTAKLVENFASKFAKGRDRLSL
jgi:hypothetical protein